MIEYTLDAVSDQGLPGQPGQSAGGAIQSALVRRITTNLLAPTTPDPQQEVICRGVRTFTLRFFDGTAWQDTWDSTTVGTTQSNVLPQAVEVTIELEGERNQPGPKATRVVLIPCAIGPAPTAAATGGTSP
jgi:hypothetical protein